MLSWPGHGGDEDTKLKRNARITNGKDANCNCRTRKGMSEEVLLQKSLQAAMRGFAAIISVAHGVQ